MERLKAAWPFGQWSYAWHLSSAVGFGAPIQPPSAEPTRSRRHQQVGKASPCLCLDRPFLAACSRLAQPLRALERFPESSNSGSLPGIAGGSPAHLVTFWVKIHTETSPAIRKCTHRQSGLDDISYEENHKVLVRFWPPPNGILVQKKQVGGK